MRCFVHTEAVAVGLCKSCGKGLCASCAVDLEQGLACRGRCEDDVRDLIGLVQHSLQMRHKAAGMLGGSRKALIGCAVMVMAVGGATIFAGDVLNSMAVLGTLGGLCIAFGLVLLPIAWRMPTVAADEPAA